MALGAFATSTLLTKNSFLDEIRKQYVLTARMKGLSEREVLYGHVFRNAMLIVVAGFPGRLHRQLLRRLAADRDDLLARRARALSFESIVNRDYPVVFASLYIFSLLGLVVNLCPTSPTPGSIQGSISRPGRLESGMSAALPTPQLDRVPVAAPAPTVAPPLPREGFIRLSPLNRRRLANFRANKRGYWSFWIFTVLFVVSLFAEFIANDKPIIASYKGEILYPVFVDYPEEKFGGFLARTDYRDPLIQKEIAENGWAVWPPVRFSYYTHNLDLPVPAPAPPTWMLTDEQCRPLAERNGGTGCRDIEWNWLGTDDQGRDVVARLLYGFRISCSSASSSRSCPRDRRGGGCVQGYFGGWTDLVFQRFIEIWTAIPALYLLIIISSIITPSFFVLLGILLLFSWVSLVGVVRAEFLRAATSNMCAPPERSASPTPPSCSSISCRTPWWRRSPSCPSSSTARSRPSPPSTSSASACPRARPRSGNCWPRARRTSRRPGLACPASLSSRPC
jgi:microcin C transport system permease protein